MAEKGMINMGSDSTDQIINTTSASASTSTQQKIGVSMEDEKAVATPDIHNVSIKIQRAKDAYREFARIEEQPRSAEIFLWYFYGLCSYFIQTVLIPIVFPLIISQVQSHDDLPSSIPASLKEVKLYQALITPSITVKDVKYTPLEWTALSWGAGILISAPILYYLTQYLDRSQNHHQLIFGVATAIGSVFCLPTGFFHVYWIFPPYIAAIVVTSIVCTASHTRHLGLMLRGFSSKPTTTTAINNKHQQIADRRSVASWLSMNATAAGCLGAAVIASFTYHMLKHSDRVVSLWVVSIFSGLKWLCGSIHAFTANRGSSGAQNNYSNAAAWKYCRGSHFFSIFKYPHAVGSVISVLLSSFTSTCIFIGGILYVVGQLRLKPDLLLFVWLMYFGFPLFCLPLSHPLQQLLRTDAVRMQLLGFLVSGTTSGLGFYYRHENWRTHHILIVVALQSAATGILHAFGRVLLLDCAPAGKEGSFSVWLAWATSVGACGGFAVASVFPGNVRNSLGVSFFTSIAGVALLVFGKISSSAGAIAAGHVRENGTGSSGTEGDFSNLEGLDGNINSSDSKGINCA